MLPLCLLASQLTEANFGSGPLTRALAESLLTLGWVASRKPLEVFLYDWWPLSRTRSVDRRLAAAQVAVVDATDLQLSGSIDARARSDPKESGRRSRSLFCRIFYAQPVSTWSENALDFDDGYDQHRVPHPKPARMGHSNTGRYHLAALAPYSVTFSMLHMPDM